MTDSTSGRGDAAGLPWLLGAVGWVIGVVWLSVEGVPSQVGVAAAAVATLLAVLTQLVPSETTSHRADAELALAAVRGVFVLLLVASAVWALAAARSALGGEDPAGVLSPLEAGIAGAPLTAGLALAVGCGLRHAAGALARARALDG
jgi:hypothetical protein